MRVIVVPDEEGEPLPYVCKRCGAQSPPGIGYVADGQTEFPAPEPGCPNPHVAANEQ